ncbi:MAG: flagellar export protein FliJ [Lachnospiraceae bacterium]|nr:flagellar export protein FliJ [Lachnospiraceae bacterium]
MAVYKFKLQGILDIKDKLETQAKQDFANANLALMEEEALLEQIIQRKNEYVEEGVKLRSSVIDPVAIAQNKLAIEVMEENKIKQEREVAVAKRNVDAARKKMMDARMDTRTFEKLKEDDFERFMKEQGMAESKEIDELNSFRFSEKQRRGE